MLKTTSYDAIQLLNVKPNTRHNTLASMQSVKDARWWTLIARMDIVLMWLDVAILTGWIVRVACRTSPVEELVYLAIWCEQLMVIRYVHQGLGVSEVDVLCDLDVVGDQVAVLECHVLAGPRVNQVLFAFLGILYAIYETS